MISAPIKWFGAKQYYLRHILPLLPESDTFVDLFGGAGSVVLNHRKAKLRVWNDANTNLWSFMVAVAWDFDPSLMPYSREEFHCAVDTDPVGFFVRSQQSFGGMRKDWSRDKKERGRGVNGWNRAIANLPSIAAELRQIRLFNKDCFRFLDEPCWTGVNTCYYIDPPYICESASVYDCRVDHNRLLEAVFRLKGHVVVSGYRNPLYMSQPWDDVVTFHGRDKTNQIVIEECLFVKRRI